MFFVVSFTWNALRFQTRSNTLASEPLPVEVARVEQTCRDNIGEWTSSARAFEACDTLKTFDGHVEAGLGHCQDFCEPECNELPRGAHHPSCLQGLSL